MKQTLQFLTSEQFQNFTSQLFSEELPSYQAVEGAGGDGGLDGLDGSSAYQVYFPEVKNRDKKHYVAKIDSDVAKLQATAKKHGFTITKWIFVVPDDLGTDVVLHLSKKSQEAGFECIYWGATKLTALVNKYPYIKDSFPEIFLPGVKQDLIELKDGISELHRNQDTFTDIITDEEYLNRKQQLSQKGQQDARQLMNRMPAGSAQQQASQIVTDATNRKIKELTEQKARSDRFYQLAREEINDFFEEQLSKKQSEIAARGLLESGIGRQEIDAVSKKWRREIERLNLKYGKQATEE